MLFPLSLFKNIFALPLLVAMFFHHILIGPPNIAKCIEGFRPKGNFPAHF